MILVQMVTWNEYLKSVFEKIIASYLILSKLEDNAGDLEIIEKELFKIRGFFNVLISKLKSENYPTTSISELKPKLESYLDTYYFEKEIETMTLLYSEDVNRIKNMRLKVLESLDESKIIQKIQDILDDLK